MSITIFSAFCVIILSRAPGMLQKSVRTDVINELDVLFPVEKTVIVMLGIHHKQPAPYIATAVVFPYLLGHKIRFS